MKRIFLFALLAGICFSCTKEVAAPDSGAATTIFFQDSNVEISNFSAAPGDNSNVLLNFSAQVSGNVASMELMSGSNINTFCTIYHIPLLSNNLVQSFAFNDSQPKGNPVYYMIRYTLKDGSFGGFSPVYTFNIH
ncbi:MAG: hypothetical protein JSS67_04705 [Bacteroidetes bacterium]|nr:hypothetical protein [Bacteroidota bacterium]